MAKYKGPKRDFTQAVSEFATDKDTTGEEITEVTEVTKEMSEESDKEKDKEIESKKGIEKASDKDKEELAQQEIKPETEQNGTLTVVKKKEVKKVDDRKKEIQEIRMPQLERELKSSKEIIGLGDDTTYVTKGTIINGNIETDGDIEILGRVDGNVRCAGKIIISGRINGDVDTEDLYAEDANITGEISAKGTVKIGAGSVTVGNISAETANIAGAVKGDVDIRDSVVIDATAVVVGNIKSREVQINSGAIIDGFCKQTYSDVDVDKYFKDEIEDLK